MGDRPACSVCRVAHRQQEHRASVTRAKRFESRCDGLPGSHVLFGMDPQTDDAIEEHRLLRAARWGSHDAFAELYRRHASAVHTLAYRATGNLAAAEDLTQEAFLKMLQFLGGLRESAPLRPWLKKVVANAAIDRLRRESRYLAEAVDEAEWTDDHATPAMHADATALLARMPEPVRLLVWLHSVEGWSHEELAARFGQSPSWSKSVISRALTRLRSELGKEHSHEAA